MTTMVAHAVAAEPTARHSWTDEQSVVIGDAPDSRQLVDAGPGTGKTAVACARVAWLIDEAGLESNQIWLISFTRTAVHEIRQRIASYLQRPETASGLRIATVDSHAWALRKGFDADSAALGTFDEGIRRALRVVQGSELASEHLHQVRHLLIDEAQDIVGDRVELMLEIIHHLPEDAGVTVLADEAQSIYTFGEDRAVTTWGSGNLPKSIREFMSDEFVERSLDWIHRTNDPALIRILRDGRGLIRNGSDGALMLDELRELVAHESGDHLGTAWTEITSLPAEMSDGFILFRRRGDALQAAGYLGQLPRRLRLSGLPPVIPSWVATALWDWTEDSIDETAFVERMTTRLSFEIAEAEVEWDLLVRLAGTSPTRVSTRRLASLLARSTPPPELSTPDYGTAGPIIGTIHAAKGREADQVWLYLPPPPWVEDAAHHQEEARVLFVGSSRARRRLRVSETAPASYARTLQPSGRAFTPKLDKGRATKAAVEFGRDQDLTAAGLVGTRFFADRAQATHAQAALLSLGSGVAALAAERTGPALEWSYRLHADGAVIGYLNPAKVNGDLFKIGDETRRITKSHKRNPPARINHLWSLGLRTLAVGPDDPARELLHDPWRDSGFLVAPLLTGYPTVFFS